MNMNTSTAITLNDRFSMIKKQPSNTSIPDGRRGRSRSRSRSRNGRNQNPDLRGSRRNQLLLNRLEQQHKVRLALKLKNKSLMASRGRAQAVNVRNRLRRANVIKKTLNRQRLRRSNSLTTFIPLNDAPGRLRQARSRSRSRSRNRVGSLLQNSSSVHDRLGVRQPRRMRRGGQQNNNNNAGQQQRGRSRSRQRLNRNNFRNTVTPTWRSNSVNARLGNNGPVQVQQNQQNRRRRFRSRSRNNAIKNNNGTNNVRNNSKNIRFRNQLNRPMTGRIVKRKINRKTGVNTTQRVRNAAARNVKKLQRGNNNNNNGQARNGRARNRGQRNNQGGQQQQRRGRSRTRRANRGKPQVSKEQLDKQLDAYMAKGSA